MTIPDDYPLPHEKVIATGEVGNVPWVAARHLNHVNGYVRLPNGHPWLDADPLYEIENSIPWGEITYGHGNWLGFDSAHSGQWWPGDRLRFPDDEEMTPEMVVGWARQLADEAFAFIDNGTYEI